MGGNLGFNLQLRNAASARSAATEAAELTQAHRITAAVVPVDLTAPDGPAALYRRTQEAGLAVDVLVNNAGFATHGVFETIALQRQLEEITLNVSALVEVTHRFLPAMVARGSGAIINVSSTSAFQPVPYMAVYGASKAFVLSFSEALYEENRARGITVLALCPGSTETPFFDVVGAAEASFGRRATPDAVVVTALAGLERRRSTVVDGSMGGAIACWPNSPDCCRAPCQPASPGTSRAHAPSARRKFKKHCCRKTTPQLDNPSMPDCALSRL